MKWAVLLLVCVYVALADALYFYLEGSEKKCFLEELPKETMVVGTFEAEQWHEQSNSWVRDPNLKIQVTVEELPQNNIVVDRKISAKGKFTFTSAESGDHNICLSTISNSWFDSSRTKITFDMDFDDPAGDSHNHRETLGELASKIHELNERVQDIRREQFSQREREAEFRDQSELTNSRVVWWTVLQLIVLGVVCVWQMRHFKNFFVAKKLV